MKKLFLFLLPFLIALGAYNTQSKYENQCSKFQGDMSTRSWPFLGPPKNISFDFLFGRGYPVMSSQASLAENNCRAGSEASNLVTMSF